MSEYMVHTVKKGDTLWGISQKYGVTVDKIKKLNSLDSNTIYSGQELKIKEKPTANMDKHPIMGENKLHISQMVQYVKKINPNFNRQIAEDFLKISPTYGVRGDIAFAQSIHETNYFRYGGDVRADQNNFAGIGATGGVPGHSFPSIEEGVTVQIQHLYAYATKMDLPSGEKLVDPRFDLVNRGSARYWEDLGGKWAYPGYNPKKYNSLSEAMKAKDSYGHKIMSHYEQMKKVPIENDSKTESFKVIIDIGHGEDTWDRTGGKGVVVKNTTYEEHTFNSKVGIELKKILDHNGFKTLYSQPPQQKEVPLSERTDKANSWKADLFWSIHANANSSKNVNGRCAFYWHTNPKAKQLAELYAAEMKKAGYTLHGNGIHASKPNSWTNFHVIRETEMTAVLTENGFMTNPDDFELIFRSDSYPKEVAKIHAKVIGQFFKVDITFPSDENASPKNPLYFVRKSWQDAASEIGSFHQFEQAYETALQHEHYQVYDQNGSLLYPREKDNSLKEKIKELEDKVDQLTKEKQQLKNLKDQYKNEISDIHQQIKKLLDES